MDSNPSSHTRWYYKFSDQIYGPFSSQELQQQIQDGNVKPDTQIRSNQNSNWVTAKSFPNIFQFKEPYSEAESASKAAEDILTGRRNRGFRRNNDEEEDEPESFINRFTGLFSKLSFSWMSDLFDILADKLELLKYCLRAWVLIPLLLLVILGLSFNFFAVDWYRRSIAYDTYSKIWTDLRHHREMDLDEHQWNEFKTDVYGELNTINASIEKAATTNDPYTMELLRAGRDCLPRMLDDARKTPSQSEKEFAIHMNKAERFAKAKYQESIPQIMTTIVGILFVVFDILLLGWGMLFVLKKVRS